MGPFRLPFRLLLPLVLPAFLLAPLPVRADPLAFAFMPPDIVPQDICAAPRNPEAVPSEGTSPEVLNELFLFYLRRDIRNLAAEDADRWFAFLLDLLAWQEELDPAFAGASADLARASLHVDAGRLEDLRAGGLLDLLRADAAALNGAQKVALAQYFLDGIGTEPDLPFAQGLIRDAAYGGNVEALLTIARLEVQGDPMPDWDAPLDLTVSLAFGGMLGPMNEGICARAERIAQEYLDGGIVARNTAISYAWFKFSADLGGAEAAWRVAEAHLSGAAPSADPAVMLEYLARAAERSFVPSLEEAALLRSAEGVPQAMLGRLVGADAGQGAEDGGAPALRPSLAHFLQLEANPDLESDPDAPYMQYLRRLTEMDSTPGFVFTRLALETLARKGRWLAEAEGIAILTEGARRGDPEAMRELAALHLRYRRDPARVSQAVSLLSEAATRFGDAAAMEDLDGLYRCQLGDAPLLPEAELWAGAFRATGAAPVEVSPGDLLVLDRYRDPEAIAQIQTLALRGETQSLAQMLERVQMDPGFGDAAARLWAERAQVSKQTLERFAELEFALATNPAERERALALFRRVYLNNGVTTALDLAIALVEHNGRDPGLAQEIVALLTESAGRGEGAAMRLLARLTADRRAAEALAIPPRTEEEVFAEFARVIEDSGDFLALMFAIPHVGPVEAADYIDRAVSLMNCGTKDVAELADAHATLGDGAGVMHWTHVGFAIEGGHTLSRLALTNRQMDLWGTGAAPSPAEVLARAMEDGDDSARRSLFALSADPAAAGYDPQRAAEQLIALVRGGDPADEAFVRGAYLAAPPAVRERVDAAADLGPAFRRAAEAGAAEAQYAYAMLLRARARGAAELGESARWLLAAAENGHAPAMAELGAVLAQGLGVPVDRAAAALWYDRAAGAGEEGAAEAARLLRLVPAQ